MPVTFLWYGQEKHPQPQLLSVETRAATSQPATTQSLTVAFSVAGHQRPRWCTRHNFPLCLFLACHVPVCQLSHFKVKVKLEAVYLVFVAICVFQA